MVFTTITKGRSGRLLADSNWRRQTWWPTPEAAYHFGDGGELQVVPHYPPHSMRHTCASWLVQRGVSLYEVQQLLGHESFQTTQRYANPRELHQTGEKSQVARSRRGLKGLRGHYELAA
ncbi:site-specific integrase [Streptomyces sp. NPDC088348]|uniref:site-specific integrase n=1 Tax=Streptomyces sp. NPDC088348 TaxID=3365853 RepID=UPI003817C790